MTTGFATVDRLEALVLVDNQTDSLSSNPRNITTEWASVQGNGQLPSGANTCWAHHGLALLITAHSGDQTHTLLFDAGPDGATLLRNAGLLGVDFAAIGDVVLSHGHWDHAGALCEAVEAIARARGGSGVNCFVHPDMFAARAATRPDGQIVPLAPLPGIESLARAGATVISTREPQVAGAGAFFVTGEIPRVTRYELGLPGALRRSGDGQSWEPDTLIMDERFVCVHVRDKGLFVFSACSHAGVINVLHHARALFPHVPLYGVMGGLHLAGPTEKIIPQTVADLRQFDLKLVAAGHCTGWRALGAMAQVFGEELVPLAVGKRYAI